MRFKRGGLTEEEYIHILKECGMCTKKWTLAKRKMFEEKRAELIEKKYGKKSKFSGLNLFKRLKKNK